LRHEADESDPQGFVAGLIEPDALALYRLIIADGWRFPALARTFERSGMATLRRRVGAIVEEAGFKGADAIRRASGLINLALGDAYLEAALGLDDANFAAHFEGQIATAVEFAFTPARRRHGR
jgi:TetR/AcrR family transcriptional repressor of mexJK operon